MDTGHIEKVLYLCIQGAALHEQIGDVECNSLTLYIKVIFNEIEKKILVSIIIVVFIPFW